MSDKEEDLDDIFDEDLEDLDDLEDLEDEILEEEDGQSAAQSGQKNGKPQKTFVQKFFFPIVLAVVFVMVMGLYFVLVGGGSPVDVSTVEIQETASDLGQQAQVVVDDLENGVMGDKQEQIDSASEDIGSQQALAVQTEDSAGLTPLPAKDDTPDALPELPGIDNEVQEEASPEGQQSNMPDLLALKNNEGQASQRSESNTVRAVSELDVSSANISNSDEQAVVQENVSTSQVSETQVAIAEEVKKIANSLQSLQVKIDSLSSQVASMQNRLDKVEKNTSDASVSVKSLENKVQTLSGEMKDAQEKLKESQKSATKSSDGSRQSSAMQKQKPANINNKPARTPAASIHDLVIKSATSGLVHISNTKTGDTKILSVGDYHNILGKIEAITYSDGKWIVRGSKNSLSR